MHASNVIAAALVAAFLPAAAHASAELAASKACLACHSTDKKLIGPAFKDVAAKYKGSPDGQKQMVRSILEGSSGKWGPIPMPANRVSEAEAGALARWVLSL